MGFSFGEPASGIGKPRGRLAHEHQRRPAGKPAVDVENVVIRALCGNARTGEPVSRLRGDDGLYARNPSKPDEDRPSGQRMIALASARARDRNGGRSYKMTAAKPRTVQVRWGDGNPCRRAVRGTEYHPPNALPARRAERGTAAGRRDAADGRVPGARLRVNLKRASIDK